MNNFITPDLSEYSTYGIGHLPTTEAIRLFTGDFVNSNGSTNWAFPALTNYVATITQYPMYVGQTGPDEWQTLSAKDPRALTLMGALLGRNPAQAHVIWGEDCLIDTCTDWFSANNPPMADFFSYEGSGFSGSTANDLGSLEKNDYSRNTYVRPARRALPDVVVTGSTGPFYCKVHTGPPYAYDPALGDTIVNGSSPGTSPMTTILDLMYPVAHGYAGFRTYFYDSQHSGNRRNDSDVCTPSQAASCAAGTSCTQQEGISPVSAYSSGDLAGSMVRLCGSIESN